MIRVASIVTMIVLGFAASGCKKGSSDAPPAAEPTTSSSQTQKPTTPPSSPPASPAEAPPETGESDVPVPADFEEEAAAEITAANYEQVLAQLEAE